MAANAQGQVMDKAECAITKGGEGEVVFGESVQVLPQTSPTAENSQAAHGPTGAKNKHKEGKGGRKTKKDAKGSDETKEGKVGRKSKLQPLGGNRLAGVEIQQLPQTPPQDARQPLDLELLKAAAERAGQPLSGRKVAQLVAIDAVMSDRPLTAEQWRALPRLPGAGGSRPFTAADFFATSPDRALLGISNYVHAIGAIRPCRNRISVVVLLTGEFVGEWPGDEPRHPAAVMAAHRTALAAREQASWRLQKAPGSRGQKSSRSPGKQRRRSPAKAASPLPPPRNEAALQIVVAGHSSNHVATVETVYARSKVPPRDAAVSQKERLQKVCPAITARHPSVSCY
jgi:hypothetical protein